MRIKILFKPFWLVAWGIGFALPGCSNSKSPWPSFASLTEQEVSPERVQDPWRLTVEGLSEAKLLLSGHESDPVLPAPALSSATTTVAIKLRVQSQDPKLRLVDLLQTQAPDYSPEQAQNALFYHMAEAGYLQLADKAVRPITAYVEMTTQRDQYLDLVFVFSLTRPALAQAGTVRFILDKAFFLSQPVEFALPATQLLPAS